MDEKPVVDNAKEKVKSIMAAAKARLVPVIEGAKTKLAALAGQAKTLHEHPQITSYKSKIKQKDPLSLGGTLVVAVVVIWAAFGVFNDTKPSDELLFDIITSDGGNGVVYDAKILARDGFQDGDNKYVVEVDYEVRWKMDQEQALKVMMELLYKEMKAEGIPEYQIKMALMFGGMSVALMPLAGQKPFKAGDRQKMSDSYTFVKAESGWRLLESE